MATGHSGPIDRFGRPGFTLNFIAGKRMWYCAVGTLSVTSYGASGPYASGCTGGNWLSRRPSTSIRWRCSSITFTKSGWLSWQW